MPLENGHLEDVPLRIRFRFPIPYGYPVDDSPRYELPGDDLDDPGKPSLGLYGYRFRVDGPHLHGISHLNPFGGYNSRQNLPSPGYQPPGFDNAMHDERV